ncbi:tyrosine-type recombinase/integrase [Micromonospora tulbaghiae]|uniref:tyrosine-type recombinase/integrase n=2 Tax=Micromonosporaceae TaxID=28056 RepID=UPI00332DE534
MRGGYSPRQRRSDPSGEALRRMEAATQARRSAGRRLHDARHTAATVLLVLGVFGRVVMGIMGWSNSAMAVRYQQ